MSYAINAIRFVHLMEKPIQNNACKLINHVNTEYSIEHARVGLCNQAVGTCIGCPMSDKSNDTIGEILNDPINKSI